LLNLVSIPVAVAKGVFPIDGSVHHVAAAIGLLTILTLVAWGRFRPAGLKLIPAPLLAAGLATVVANVMELPISYVKVPESLLDAVTLPTMDRLAHLAEAEFLVAGLALAFVASAETLLSAAAVDRMHHGPRARYDRELAAQGVGNLICGILGALPMTGVIVRSSANVQAGARSRLSAILHGIWLLAIVGSVPLLLQRIPTAALAAILVHTGYKLVNVDNLRNLAAYGRLPLVIYGATVAGIVGIDLLTGVLLGIALSVAKLLYQMSHLHLRFDWNAESRRADLHLEGAATFLRLPALADILDQLPAGTELHLHFDRLTYIDHACMDLLANWDRQNREKGSQLVVEWDDLATRYREKVTARVSA